MAIQPLALCALLGLLSGVSLAGQGEPDYSRGCGTNAEFCSNGNVGRASKSTGSNDAAKAAANAVLIEQGVQLLNSAVQAQDAAEQQRLQEQAEERERSAAFIQGIRQQQQENKDAFDAAMSSGFPAAPKGCDCTRTQGTCLAKIDVLQEYKTGLDFRVSSSAPRCSKVSYYIDNTPYLTVLNETNTQVEHSAAGKVGARVRFEIEKCETCQYEGN